MFDFLKKRNSETAPQPSAVNTEQIEYALQFESVLSNMEAHFRNSMDYRGVGINALKMVCEFYHGDWAGVILAELDLSIKLYKGEFFASTNSEEWVQPVARSYTLRYMHLINEVLSTLAEVGDIAGVHHYAQKGIDHAPENVKAHFWLIHAVRCGVAPELAKAELEWSKERLTDEEYADLLELLAKTEQPDMTLNVKI